MIKRSIDFAMALLLIPLLAIPMLLIATAVKLTSPGPVLYWSDRVGRYNRLFRMPKFRTMRIDTPALATHLLTNPAAHLTLIGGRLRRLSLDELPQIWSVLSGEMSLVGPRPALFNQADLVRLRTAAGIERLRPGITGLAQVNGRDDLSIEDKVTLECEYLRRASLNLDLWILWRTVAQAFTGTGVSH